MNTHVTIQPKPAAKSDAPVRGNFLQRKCNSQSAIRNDLSIPPVMHDIIRSPGQPLDAATREFMEPRFGHDFGHIRVHTDARAAESASAVGALAYTVGQNVVFAGGRYAPHTKQGRKLLVHELTHTIQQRSLGSAVSGDRSISMEAPDTSFERAAEQRAAGIGSASERVAPLQQIALQRQPASSSEIEMPAEWAFAADKRKSTWRHYAKAEAQKDAVRIRKNGKISSQDREEITAKLHFFEGDAWKVYVREMKPALLEVTVLEERRRREERQREEQKRKEEEQRREEERKIREGTAAYYQSTRQSQLEAAAAAHAKFREGVPKMTIKEIYSQWDAEKPNFLKVASSATHTLDADQLLMIWRLYWNDRWKTGRAKLLASRNVRAEERLAAEEAAQADEDTASYMLRAINLAQECIYAAENAGKHLTLDELNEATIEAAKFHDAMVAASGMVIPGGGRLPTIRGGHVEPVGATTRLPPDVGASPPPTTTPELITPSRPVAGFGRDIEPAPQPVPASDPYVTTQMPRARMVQGNQPTYGAVAPAVEIPGQTPTATPSRRVTGFQPPKDIPEKGMYVEVDIGEEYVKREYFGGDVNPVGEQQARYYVDIKLDKRGMMNSDVVLRGGGRRSGSLSGKDEFLAAKQHFEQRNGADSVKGAYGRWGGGDNLNTFNTRYQVARNKGFSHDEAMVKAARETKTGEWSKAAGFNNVNITKAEGSPGAYTNVEVEFTK